MIISDMHHRKTYIYLDFQQTRVDIDQSKPCTQIYLQNINIKITQCFNFDSIST